MFKVLRILRFYSIEPHARSIKATGIQVSKVDFNPSIPQIYLDTFVKTSPIDQFTQKSFVSTNGALCAYSGKVTQRQTKNSRIVKDVVTEKSIEWNESNLAINAQSYELIEKIAIDYINHRPKLYLIDGYLGWDPNYRLKVRSYCTRTYHALFLRNILVKPTKAEIQQDFTTSIDIKLFNAGQFDIPKSISGTQNEMISAINLSEQKITILGSQFAGQMKKSLFKLSSYILPKKDVLPLRGSAYTNQSGGVCLLLGLPGSGKGSLPIHAKKQNIIANDQIGWSPNGIYNLEGGIYARILNLRNKLQDQVYNAIKFGAVVQNANPTSNNREIDFYDSSVTQNARLCYPINHLKLIKNPPISTHPNHLILLTCDLEGVLPPVAQLSKQQALFFYLTGYNAKLNKKLIQPKSEFSVCFSGGTLTHHPEIYLKLLKNRIQASQTKIWLINTGWINGRYGVGKRMESSDSTTILDAINKQQLENVQTYNLPYFNYKIPKYVKGIDENVLIPGKSWSNKQEYQQSLKKLAEKFIQNYQQNFQHRLNMDISHGLPRL